MNLMALTATLGLDTSEFEKGTSKSRIEMQALLSSATEFGSKISSAMEAGLSKVASFGKGLWDMGKQASVMADDMITLATKTGISTDKLQEYGYAARFVDTEVSTITGSMVKLTKNMTSSSEETANAFKTLGISVTDSKGRLRDTESVFWEAIDALGKMTNETERDSLAMTIFGKSAQELNPLIKAGSETWNQYANEAREAGLVLSGEGMGALGTFNDALQRMDATFEAVKNQIMAALAPAFQVIADKITDVAQRIAQWVRTDQAQKMFENIAKTVGDLASKFAQNLQPAIEKGISVLSKVGDAVDFVSKHSSELQTVLTAVVTAFVALKTAMAALNIVGLVTNPIGAVVVAITGLIAGIALLIQNWDKVREAGAKAWSAIQSAWNSAVSWFSNIVKGITNSFSNIGSTLSGYFSNAWSSIQKTWNSVTSWFSNISNGIKNAFSGISGTLSGYFSSAWNSIKNAWSGVTSHFTNIKNSIISAFSSLPSSMTSVGKNIVEGLWNGINSMVSWISSKVKGFTDSVVSGFKNFFGIHSPSSVMRDQIGRYLSLGVAEGIEKEEGAVDKAFQGLMPDMGSYSGALGLAGAAASSSMIVNINVDGAKYSDERSLAEAIAEELQAMVDRRQAVFA